jgi:superfamily II DNA or RNA helicase
MPARYRIGVSADVKRKDRKEPLMHDLFGDVAVDVDRDDLIRSGHVLDVEVRAVPTAFAAPWYGMRDENDSTDTREIDFMRLVREMSDDPARNDQIVRIALEEVRAGHQVLVMAHLREHCMRLGQLINAGGARCGYLIGGDDSAAEFASTAAGLKNGTMRVGVGTYKAVGMGLDLPQVSVGIAATPIAANRQFFGQVRGRICRTSKGKTVARLYVLLDANVFPRHVKNMAAWNSTVMVLERDGSWVSARQ